eukprot:TRINITY_DN1506_c0_g1_i1.p1 TRINITY_DN1506_c0_g1~~TRINITY_DN1506_c0_g1_i1.p1  ORF type:complete len:146 (+),score=37.44 TRINITY_DN1506_c0_g1_i1:31-468(+)
MAINKRHCTHLGLHCNNSDLSKDFYVDYCGLMVLSQRTNSNGKNIYWLAEDCSGSQIIYVLLPELNVDISQKRSDFSHIGIACTSREEVIELAEKAKKDNCLVIPPKDMGDITGFICIIKDPDGRYIEFSYEQAMNDELSFELCF